MTSQLGSCWPGIFVAVLLTVVANFLSHAPVWPFSDQAGHHPLDPVLIAIVLGLVLGNLRPLPHHWRPGIAFTARKVLALGIILLGARLDFRALMQVGAAGVAFSICTVGAALLLFRGLVAVFKLDRMDGILLGVGTAICGGTAIVAVAPLLRARDENVFIAIAVVTLIGVGSMLLLPTFGMALGLSDWQFGVWAGLTIHQTPQVIAAGFAVSPAAGQTATVVKLARVCLLAPVALMIGMLNPPASSPPGGIPYKGYRAVLLIPAFVWGFLLMAVIRTLGIIPEVDLHWSTPLADAPIGTRFSMQSILVEAAGFLLAMSMAAVGLETDVRVIGRRHLRPVAAAAVATAVLAVFTLGMVYLAGGHLGE